MKLSENIQKILLALSGLPRANKVVVFGDVATGASNPVDLRVCLRVPDCVDADDAHYKYTDGFWLLKLARVYHEDLLVFVETGVSVRGDFIYTQAKTWGAYEWTAEKNQSSIRDQLECEGKPLLELVEQLTNTGVIKQR